MDCWRSPDAGKVFSVFPVQHGDCHDLWIDPADPRRVILGDDGGASVTLDGGESRLHLTGDGGQSWTEITPSDLPDWATVRMIDASPHEAGTAYVAAKAHKLDDFRPYLWRTRDFGASWERLDQGLDEDEYCHVLREDPRRRGLPAALDRARQVQARKD